MVVQATELVLATHNAHKLTEARRILRPYGLTVLALPRSVQLPPELGATFEANALPKARAAAAVLKRSVIADDSGLEAVALGGAPGVRSARFAGEHATDAENLAKLLAHAPAGSGVRYVCALAFVDPGLQERVFRGECAGVLAPQARGTGGFGYDPAFLPQDGPAGLTMAEIGPEAKDRISHRGRALRAFARWYVAQLEAGVP
ncbi:MAG: RdgB/HAM1 family non-canonical purine NTP pyrophosphatase [Solirubrobacteraceae bacterium]